MLESSALDYSRSGHEVWYIVFVYKHTEVRECLLSFGAESFVFQFAIQKFKD